MWRGQLSMLHPKLRLLERLFSASPLQQIVTPLIEKKGIEVWVKRDDLIHPVISGNKWRKLKYILHHALTIDSHTIISMGGAYSNHLHALAYVGKQLQVKTIGYIRGEKPRIMNATLKDLQTWGMELRFISRAEYKILRQYKNENALPTLKADEYWLPEGGSTELALQGAGEILTEIDMDFDVVCVPCGTGTTLAGLIGSMNDGCYAIGFSALKGGEFLVEDVEKLLNINNINWDVKLDYHFGGFAKSNDELLLFIETFAREQNIELEPVYTGKMFYGIFDLIETDFFNPGQKIVAIHTGGLQGKRKTDLEEK
jgi:1-aminocyclopropane-1-carboxylate deaminase